MYFHFIFYYLWIRDHVYTTLIKTHGPGSKGLEKDYNETSFLVFIFYFLFSWSSLKAQNNTNINIILVFLQIHFSGSWSRYSLLVMWNQKWLQDHEKWIMLENHLVFLVILLIDWEFIKLSSWSRFPFSKWKWHVDWISWTGTMRTTIQFSFLIFYF